MPLYLCRWPNGDCSVVWAANKGEAIELLDEVDNAEGCPLTALGGRTPCELANQIAASPNLIGLQSPQNSP